MSQGNRSFLDRFFMEYQCVGCGGYDAYRSRPRNSFEKWALRLMLLRAVRCNHCYRRSYVFASVSVPERALSNRSDHSDKLTA